MAWVELEAKLKREWLPGEHVTLVGPTGAGKTHMMLTLARLCRYVLVIATKRRDPLVTKLRETHKLTANLSRDVIWSYDGQPIDRRLLFWPRAPEKASAKQRHDMQAEAIRGALDWADKTGGWAVLVDELMWAAKQLRLQEELEAVWFQGRTQGVSMIAAAQRPRHVPLLAFSQATYVILWQTSDSQDIERLREISSGFPRQMMEQAVASLDWESHEALFIDTRRKELARVVAPASI